MIFFLNFTWFSFLKKHPPLSHISCSLNIIAFKIFWLSLELLPSPSKFHGKKTSFTVGIIHLKQQKDFS